MYYTHNLRTELQEWKNRLSRASYEHFPNQLKYLLANLEKNKLINGILVDACIDYPLTDEEMEGYEKLKTNGGDLDYENETDHAAYCIQFFRYLIKKHDNYDFHIHHMYYGKDFDQSKNNVIEDLVTPLFYFLHDKLDQSNSTVYLLEKYKRRTEWFTREDLAKKYSAATKSYEQIFEDDLRLFLFDQGIDYPFSTPKSRSGRADIIGSIDTSDPIVLEIKIFDRAESYGKNRIIEGFTQVVKYASDYNKSLGYLVIFNMDKAEINFNFSSSTKSFPSMISFNSKTFFFVIINIAEQDSASNIGKLDVIDITETELTQDA